jgi:hypothetical protein
MFSTKVFVDIRASLPYRLHYSLKSKQLLRIAASGVAGAGQTEQKKEANHKQH